MKKSILALLLFTLILASCEAPRKCSAYPKTPKKNIYSPSHNY
jgi:nitrous oxide reductase accessory protein NosL